MLCGDGECVVVPTIGIPYYDYATLDDAYNLWLNDMITEAQLDNMLVSVPGYVEDQYIDNLLVTILYCFSQS